MNTYTEFESAYIEVVIHGEVCRFYALQNILIGRPIRFRHRLAVDRQVLDLREVVAGIGESHRRYFRGLNRQKATAQTNFD